MKTSFPPSFRIHGIARLTKALAAAMAVWTAAASVAASAEGDQVTVRVGLEYLEAGRAERLDLYLPANRPRDSRSPAVLWIHGGGWTGGTRDAKREKSVCQDLAAHGYVCASIDYKLGKGAWPQNLFDCKNGVRYLRAHAAELGIDPDRIAVGGGSAGGHLALMVGLTAGEAGLEPAAPYPNVTSNVRAILDFYGITDIATRQETTPDGTPTGKVKLSSAVSVFGGTDPQAEVFKIGSPVSHVSRKSPPVLILHGLADTTVDHAQAEELARVLQEKGVPHQLVLLDGIGHTFDLHSWGKKPVPPHVREDVLAFLAQHLGRP